MVLCKSLKLKVKIANKNCLSNIKASENEVLTHEIFNCCQHDPTSQ